MDIINIIIFVGFFILLFLGVPIAFTMLFIGVLGMANIIGFIPALASVKSSLYYSVSNWLYICIPMFILMGLFASRSGIIMDIYDYFNIWFRRLPGALGIVTIATGAMFAFSTGSSLASTAVLGKLTLKEMDRHKYSRKLSLGCIVAGGSLGNLIPPSIGLVLYGIITETSIGKLLTGAIIPGLITALFFSLLIIGMVKRNPSLAPRVSEDVTLGMNPWVGIKKIAGLLIIIVLVLGSIFTGIATPTEAASVGAFSSFLLVILKKRFNLRYFGEDLNETTRTTAMIFIIVVGVTCFSRFLNFSGFSRGMVDLLVTSAAIPPGVILFFVIVILTIAGMLMDATSMLLIFTPILFPIMKAAGYDPVWYGVLTVIMIEIGFLTPPVGLCCYVLKSVSDASLDEIFRSIYPFLIAWYSVVLLVSVFPQIVLFLPNLMMGG